MDAFSDVAPLAYTPEQEPAAVAKKPTATDSIVESYGKGLDGPKFTELFSILRAHGLTPLGKSNTDTLLFQMRDGDSSKKVDVLAFRRKPAPVISFPKSYWDSRATARAKLCQAFEHGEQPAVAKGVGSTSQQSAGQIAITKATMERLRKLCAEVCAHVGLKAN